MEFIDFMSKHHYLRLDAMLTQFGVILGSSQIIPINYHAQMTLQEIIHLIGKRGM